MGVLSLSTRRVVPEKMDSDGLSPPVHRGALVGLRRINHASNAPATLWRPIESLCKRDAARTWTMLDVATGAGDIPVWLATRARERGINLKITAIDRSGTAVEHARAAAAAAGVEIDFQQRNAVADDWPGTFDVVASSLFLHHLSRRDCVTVLAKMGRCARKLVVVSDLDRCPAGWAAAWVGCRLLTRSPIVHYDGPASVAAAWTPPELRQMARDAGLRDAHVVRCWPWRMLLTCRPNAGSGG